MKNSILAHTHDREGLSERCLPLALVAIVSLALCLALMSTFVFGGRAMAAELGEADESSAVAEAQVGYGTMHYFDSLSAAVDWANQRALNGETDIYVDLLESNNDEDVSLRSGVQLFAQEGYDIDGNHYGYTGTVSPADRWTSISQNTLFGYYNVAFIASGSAPYAMPLCLTASGGAVAVTIYEQDVEADAFLYNSDLCYSFDGSEWISLNVESPKSPRVTIPAGQSCYFKLDDGVYDRTKFRFVMAKAGETDGTISASGTISSLLGYNDTPLESDEFKSLFEGCTLLTDADELFLPATQLGSRCYASMFRGCTSLVSPPGLFALTLADGCCCSMFEGCMALSKAPDLCAKELAVDCYDKMFSGCQNISSVNVGFMSWLDGATDDWLAGVADEGVITCPADCENPSFFSDSTVPVGWTVLNGIEKGSTCSVTLGSEIGLNFYERIPGQIKAGSKPSMHYSIEGKGSIAGEEFGVLQTDGRYKFTAYVNSLQMADTVTVTLTWTDPDDAQHTAMHTTSVCDYLNTLADQTKESYDGVNGILNTLACNMVDYGYYSQRYLKNLRGFKLSDEEGADSTNSYTAIERIGAGDIDVPAALPGYAIENPDELQFSFSLLLDSNTSLKISLKDEDATPTKVEYAGFKTDYTFQEISPLGGLGSTYLIDGISAHLLGDRFQIKATYGSGGDAEVKTVTLSALSYADVALKDGSSSEALRSVCAALYAYYQASMEYREAIGRA